MPPPSSMQQPAPGSKSAKFVGANPLDPMIKPFSESDDDPERAALAQNVNERLQATLFDLQQKHQTGQNETDHPDRAPTGPAYQAIRLQQQQQQHKQQSQSAQVANELQSLRIDPDNRNNDDSDDDDDEFDDLLDDPALDELREQRLQEMKQQHDQKVQHLALGHGQYRTVSQDEFLPECNTDGFVVAHFAHDEFERCKIMDGHLQQLAQQYLECKFVRLLAEKTPFFVQKLQVRTLPTLLVFHEGKLVHRLTGFEGLVPSQPPPAETSKHDDKKSNPDQFETWRLAKWLGTTGAIQYKGPIGEERETLLEQKAASRKHGTVYRGGFGSAEDYDES